MVTQQCCVVAIKSEECWHEKIVLYFSIFKLSLFFELLPMHLCPCLHWFWFFGGNASKNACFCVLLSAREKLCLSESSYLRHQ